MSDGGRRGLAGAERDAAIALACLVEPATAGIAEMVAEHGVGQTLSRVLSAGRGRHVAGRLDPEDAPGMVAEMSRRGVRVVLPGDMEFPTQLLDLSEPPLALWVRGPLDLRAAALRSVAVVGARACTAYGQRATSILAGGLAEEGWAVVSGGAFGIDAAAHRGALSVGGPTIAVLACGVDIAYPRSHDAVFARIADAGLIDWAMIGWLGTFQIGLAYVLIVRAVPAVPAFEVTLLLMTEPAFNPLFAWMVHGEIPGRLPICGGLLICSALVLKSWLDARSSQSVPPTSP